MQHPDATNKTAPPRYVSTIPEDQPMGERGRELPFETRCVFGVIRWQLGGKPVTAEEIARGASWADLVPAALTELLAAGYIEVVS
jgi:hypothetical protein